MATWKTEDGKTLRATIPSMVGKRVRSIVELNSGRARIPTGTVFVVLGNSRKAGVLDSLYLESLPCGHCGIAIKISAVPCADVVVVAEPRAASPVPAAPAAAPAPPALVCGSLWRDEAEWRLTHGTRERLVRVVGTEVRVRVRTEFMNRTRVDGTRTVGFSHEDFVRRFTFVALNEDALEKT